MEPITESRLTEFAENLRLRGQICDVELVSFVIQLFSKIWNLWIKYPQLRTIGNDNFYHIYVKLANHFENYENFASFLSNESMSANERGTSDVVASSEANLQEPQISLREAKDFSLSPPDQLLVNRTSSKRRCTDTLSTDAERDTPDVVVSSEANPKEPQVRLPEAKDFPESPDQLLVNRLFRRRESAGKASDTMTTGSSSNVSSSHQLSQSFGAISSTSQNDKYYQYLGDPMVVDKICVIYCYACKSFLSCSTNNIAQHTNGRSHQSKIRLLLRQV